MKNHSFPSSSIRRTILTPIISNPKFQAKVFARTEKNKKKVNICTFSLFYDVVISYLSFVSLLRVKISQTLILGSLNVQMRNLRIIFQVEYFNFSDVFNCSSILTWILGIGFCFWYQNECFDISSSIWQKFWMKFLDLKRYPVPLRLCCFKIQIPTSLFWQPNSYITTDILFTF